MGEEHPKPVEDGDLLDRDDCHQLLAMPRDHEPLLTVNRSVQKLRICETTGEADPSPAETLGE